MEASLEGSDAGSDQGKMKRRVNSLRLKAKDKVQQLKNRTGHRGVDHLDVDVHDALPDIDQNPAFNPDRVQEALQEHHETFSAKVNRTGTKFEQIAQSVIHPQQSARHKAARETAETLGQPPSGQPGYENDRLLIDAQDKLNEAKRDTTVDGVLKADGPGLVTPPEYYLSRVMDLEEHRDRLKVGYAMTHVNRVRVVVNDRYSRPRWQEYMHRRVSDGQEKFNWLGFLGAFALYHYQSFGAQYIDDAEEHPFEVNVLRSHIERLAMITAPWQAFFMYVQSVYRWEDPVRTTRWLLLYLVLWYTERCMLYIVGWVIWSTIRDGFIHASADEIRRSMKRAADSQSTAWHLGELLDKHDSEDWLSELGKAFGPGAQLMLGDLADLFEMLANFREWRSPKNTAATLVLLLTQLIICLMSWDFAARYLYGILGLMFFVVFPIQSLHPKYRRVASLVNVMFFNVPTHAQWAFGYLRRQALLGQLAVLDEERKKSEPPTMAPDSVSNIQIEYPPGESEVWASEAGSAWNSDDDVWLPASAYIPARSTPYSNDSDSDSDRMSHFVEELGSTQLVSFHADWQGKHGRLIITALGLHFQRVKSKRLAWILPYSRLNEMRKLDSVKKVQSKLRALTNDKAVSSGDRMLLQDTDGEERVIQLPKDRDACFNCVIGFSGLQWQALQHGAVANTDKVNGADRKQS